MIVTLQKERLLWIFVVATNGVKNVAKTATTDAAVSVREVLKVRAVRKVLRASAAAVAKEASVVQAARGVNAVKRARKVTAGMTDVTVTFASSWKNCAAGDANGVKTRRNTQHTKTSGEAPGVFNIFYFFPP